MARRRVDVTCQCRPFAGGKVDLLEDRNGESAGSSEEQGHRRIADLPGGEWSTNVGL